MNENDAYIFDVEQPRDWVFTGEPVWISGWFLSKVGAVFSDVRAVIDGLPYLGILGLPRPDIETGHRGWTGLPHAGFLLRLTPPRGARELRIELLDAGHRWVEIWRTGLTVRQGPAPGADYALGVLPDHLHRLLQARREKPACDLAAIADSLVLEGAARPLDTLPNPPFFGALEKPELVGGTQYGKVRVEGWIIHREQRIVRLIGSTHPCSENEFSYGDRPRPEAAALFSGHPHAAHSQYLGLIDIDETAPGPAILKLFAELEDGSRHLVFARRFYPRSCQTWERPLPAFQLGEFADCALAMRAAARRHGITTGSLSAQWRALQAAYALYRREAPEQLPTTANAADPYVTWQQRNRLTQRVREKLAATSAAIAGKGPGFLLLIDSRDCTEAQSADLARSLSAQIYARWEACWVGPVGPGAADPRWRHEAAPGSTTPTPLFNAAAAASSANFVALLPGHARLSPDALLEIAERVAAQPDLELIYTDEDRMDDAGLRSEPDFKPEWSPALALSGLFPGHLCVVRKTRFASVGGLREAFAAVASYDLLLRSTENLGASQVAHVPLVCYHGRAVIPRELDLAHPAYEQARTALAEAMARRGWLAAPFLPEAGHFRRQRFHQLRWNAEILARLPVTIVIPTRDRLHLLQECVEQLEATVDWRHVRLVIVDDHSRDTDAVRYLERIQQRTDLRCIVVRLTDPHAPFNYSRLVNAALPHVDTPLILHLNNDVNALEPGWLEEMAAWFTQDDVGVVGAKLIYPDRTLNHTGLVIGPHGGLADTPWARRPEAEVDVRWHAAAREVSAVTGACLLTRADLYRQLGGFDEGDFAVAYNDTDYCLRIRRAGHRVLFTPQAKLMHWGSATRGVTFDEAEHVAWLQRYPGFRDPYFSPHWRLDGAEVRCDPDAGGRAARVDSLRLLLVTHNLNLEGAPLFLLELATHLVREGFTLQVLAGQDGPLQSAYRQRGIAVRVADTAPLLAAQDDAGFERELALLAHDTDWDQVDLVIANSLLSFWGVSLARQAGRASLLYIHESTSVFRCFETKLALPLHARVHAALREATQTLFLCAATRAYYADDDRGNFRLVTSWIDLAAVTAFREQHARAGLRRKHGLREDEIIIANIGTVCERKGQHVFVRAAAHFNRHYRGTTPVRFLMVGGRPGLSLELIERDIARLGLKNLTIIPETPDAYDFFALADQFVCSSFEESLPRVIMEAMAFRTPIVSTDVHGIVDLIGQRQDGYLVRAGDAEGLSRMMQLCLAKERSGKSLAPTAHSRVRRFHDAAHVLPRHARLVREAWLAD